LIADQKQLDSISEHDNDVPYSPNTKLLSEKAKELNIDISVGYAERAANGKGYNTSKYYSAKEGKVISKYRKVCLHGSKKSFPDLSATNHLEKLYLVHGNLGFKFFRAPDLLSTTVKRGWQGTAAGQR
jgi:hypothetical protein